MRAIIGVGRLDDNDIQGGIFRKEKENERPIKKAKKSLSWKLPSFMMLMMMMCVLTPAPTQATTIANSQPVL
jgi:hypothetical protein